VYFVAQLTEREVYILAIHKSAIKRDKQNKKRRMRNKNFKSLMKTKVKTALTAMGEKDAAKAQALLKETISTISKIASKGIIHKNTASRKISRLTKRVNTLPTA
jgi:small subunit ribosomal protein S20